LFVLIRLKKKPASFHQEKFMTIEVLVARFAIITLWHLRIGIKDAEMNRLFAWSALLLWCVFIFTLSAQPAEVSNELSKGMTEIMMEHTEKVFPEGELDIGTFNQLVRKNAHFFFYLILGMLVIRALQRSGKSGKRAFALAWVISVLYAMSDEFHQVFVPGRGAQIRDVVIDSAGAIVGIGVYLMIEGLIKNRTR
jgi:VanZ family protein